MNHLYMKSKKILLIKQKESEFKNKLIVTNGERIGVGDNYDVEINRLTIYKIQDSPVGQMVKNLPAKQETRV